MIKQSTYFLTVLRKDFALQYAIKPPSIAFNPLWVVQYDISLNKASSLHFGPLTLTTLSKHELIAKDMIHLYEIYRPMFQIVPYHPQRSLNLTNSAFLIGSIFDFQKPVRRFLPFLHHSVPLCCLI